MEDKNEGENGKEEEEKGSIEEERQKEVRMYLVHIAADHCSSLKKRCDGTVTIYFQRAIQFCS